MYVLSWCICISLHVPSSLSCKVTEYKHTPQDRDPLNLGWVDTDLKAEIQRVKVQLDTRFLDRVLVYIYYNVFIYDGHVEHVPTLLHSTLLHSI